ncbi:uncharacterized protein LOC119159979 isoform X2 [Rhipicephalus microplus]|uniref:uncharacterized protein LOC119159979 isoform X2 n=1 Tax=Rhipicephalus microplus TaxID=6941 RepID=UPI003F6A6F47
MKLLKPAYVNNMTLMPCGVFILLLTIHQARSAAGGVLIVPIGASTVVQPSRLGIPSTGLGATGMNMGGGPMSMGLPGMGSMRIGSVGMGNMGMSATGSGIAQKPPSDHSQVEFPESMKKAKTHHDDYV